MGGIGKSLLAQEYALRFGAGYPGGVIWLRASEGGRGALLPPDRLEALRTDQMRTLAVELWIKTEGQSAAGIDARIKDAWRERGQPFLWILDDWPQGSDNETLKRWSAPVPGLGRTLVTTRSQLHKNLGTTLALSTLEPEDAYALLTRGGRPDTRAEETAARQIVERLGRHALAVDVAGAAVQALGYPAFLAMLDRPGEALELAEELAADLPNSHEKSVFRTLKHSLDSLDLLTEAGRDVLLLATELANAPIPSALVAAVLREADGLTEAEATKRAALGLNAAQKLSLAEEAGAQSFTVHVLVAATLRHEDAFGPRREMLRTAAVMALNKALWPAVEDNRKHPGIAPWMPHARALTAEVTGQATLGLLNRVWVYDDRRGAYLAAAEMARQWLANSQTLLGTEHPDTLVAMSNLAWTLRNQGELAEARTLQEQVLEINKRAADVEHQYALSVRNNLAVMLEDQGDLVGARELHEQTLDIRKRVLGAEHRNTLTSMNNLAGILGKQGDHAGAWMLNEQALESRKRVLGEDHPETLNAMNNLALILWGQGERAAARAMLEEGLAGCRRVLTDEHPDTARTFQNLAAVLAALGEDQARRDLLASAPELARRVFG